MVALRIAAVGAQIDHLLNERKRRISGQMRPDEAVRFTRERSVMLGSERHDITLSEAEGQLAIAFADGTRILVASGWKPGDPVWNGTIDGTPVAMQVRTILNGVQLSHAGAFSDVRVYTRREADLAAIMPKEKKKKKKKRKKRDAMRAPPSSCSAPMPGAGALASRERGARRSRFGRGRWSGRLR